MMQRYVVTGKEEHILKQLKEGNPVMILGLPGSGKSTLARYIAMKMAREEGYIPIILSPRHYSAQPQLKKIVDNHGNPFYMPLVPIKMISESERSLVLQVVEAATSQGILEKITDIISNVSNIEEYVNTVDNSIKTLLEIIGIRGVNLQHISIKLKSIIEKEPFDKILDITQSIVIGMTIFEGISAIGNIWKTGRELYTSYKDSKVKSKASKFVFLIDDYMDYSLSERNVLSKLITELSNLGSRVIIVNRIPIEKLANEGKQFTLNSPEYVRSILSEHTLIESSEQVIFIGPIIDSKKFLDIIHSNGINIDPNYGEKLKALTSGLPGFAVMLAKVSTNLKVNIDDLLDNLPQADRVYYPLDVASKNQDQIMYNLKGLIKSNEFIYKELSKRNKLVIPLLLTPLEKSILEILGRLVYGDQGKNKLTDLIFSEDIVHLNGYVYVGSLNDHDRQIVDEIYDLTELYSHLRTFIPYLIRNDAIRTEISRFVNLMLEAINSTSEYSENGLISILKILELVDNYELEVTFTLIINAGIQVANSQSPIIYEVTIAIFNILSKTGGVSALTQEDKLRLLSFLWQYSDSSALNPYVIEEVDHKISTILRELTKELPDNNIVRFLTIATKVNTIRKKVYSPFLKKERHMMSRKIEQVIESIRILGDTWFDKYAKMELYLKLGEIFTFSPIPLTSEATKENIQFLRNAEKLLNELEANFELLQNDKDVNALFSTVFIRDNKEDKQKRIKQLLELRIFGSFRLTYYTLAFAFLFLGNIEEARKYVSLALKYSKKEFNASGKRVLNWILLHDLSMRINVIKNGLNYESVKEFIEFAPIIKEYLLMLPPENTMTLIAEIIFVKYYSDRILKLNIKISKSVMNSIKELELILRDTFPFVYNEIHILLDILERKYKEAYLQIIDSVPISQHDFQIVLEFIAASMALDKIEDLYKGSYLQLTYPDLAVVIYKAIKEYKKNDQILRAILLKNIFENMKHDKIDTNSIIKMFFLTY
ncbi:nSTAND3 domain-containing NTPase [Thermococcus camini]|uniref:Novel STAND NTPase 3 domain-containing protein n=1 Tax=Thermococcus camini TaxID=2016373 RepID=A0A7G2D5S9_9EURY|nr:hypothetical protein [Thermococcus camini]CAD5243609.1 protein of unknown function [Thermococcus camini]